MSFKSAVAMKKVDAFRVSPDDLTVSDFTGRKEGPSEKAVNDMADSLILHGQLTDVVVRKEFDGKLVVISGHTKVMAGRKINAEKRTGDEPFLLRVTYKSVNAEQAAILTFKENDEDTRHPLNPVDIAFTIETFSNRFGWSDSEIAQKLGKEPSWVSQHRTIGMLDEPTQKQISNGELKMDHGMHLAAIEPKSRKKVIDAAKKNGNGKVTSRGIVQAAEELNVPVARPLKHSESDWKKLVEELIQDTPVGPFQKFLFGYGDYRAGVINAETLKSLHEKVLEAMS